ncbi:MAG: YfcC family protein [Faecousia sp.]
MEKKKWYQKMPHTYVILFCMALLAAVLTWVLPAGSFERAIPEGMSRAVIVPGTYAAVDSNPITPWALIRAIPEGMIAAGNIIFLIMLSTGCFNIIGKTGALESGVGIVLRKVNANKKLSGTAIIFLMTFLFSLLGVIVGPEIQIPFVALAVTIGLGLGYDVMTGLAIIIGGGGCGFALGPINASVIGTSDAVMGLPTFSGQGLRWIMWFCGTVLVAAIISLYAKKVKADPEKSMTKEVDTEGMGFSKPLDEYTLNGRQKAVLLVLLGILIAIIIGASKLGWYLNEMSAVFIIGGVLAGIAGGMKLNEIMDGFSGGAKNAANIALIVGIARSIQVVLENGKIMDTVIYYLSSPLQGMSPILAAIAITVIVGIVHFFIPSGSGIAVAMMPIIGPVAMTLGLTAQTAVLAFQVGATVPNFILPTVGAYVAMCSIARVPVNKWWKFGWRLTIPLYVLSWVFVVIAVLINYGPF